MRRPAGGQVGEELLAQVLEWLHRPAAQHDGVRLRRAPARLRGGGWGSARRGAAARLREDRREVGCGIEVEHAQPRVGAGGGGRAEGLQRLDVQQHPRVLVGVGEALEQSDDGVQSDTRRVTRMRARARGEPPPGPPRAGSSRRSPAACLQSTTSHKSA